MTQVPYNEAAEEAVLGSILIDPECIHDLRGRLQPEHFYLRKHRWIYEAILRLDRQHTPLDYLTLTSELDDRQQLEQIGGGAYISSLINAVPSAINADAYADEIRGDWLRRRLLNIASEIAKAAHDESKPPREALTDVESRLFQLHDKAQRAERQPKKFNRVADEVWARLQRASESDQRLAFPTGYSGIDAKLGGLMRGGLYVVAARPGIGKSALLGNFAYKIAYRGRHVAMFNLEMTNRQFFHRLLVMQGYGNLTQLENGTLPDGDWAKVAEGIGAHSELPIWSDEQPALTVPELRAKAIRLASRYGLDVVFVDYAQLMRSTEQWGGSRQQQMGEVTRGLKRLAKELDIPVVTAVQLNRKAEGVRPQLEHLREAGDFENDADAVLLIHRSRNPQVDPRTHVVPALVIIAKHRHGPTGDVPVGWIPHRVAFVPTKAN